MKAALRRSTLPTPDVRNALRRALLRWYDEHARPLPWRRHRGDSYRIWVAEVMLQQTRLQAALPAYRRFLRAFPTLTRLGHASEEQVLSAWSGLGYYSRARSLHRAARMLCANGQRGFPRTMEAARALPGVGPYIAAAVLSIAYDLPHAAIDGNVVRVLSRLACLPRPNGRGEPCRSFAEQLLERRRPGDWNQALMELGQTICLPKTPRCGRCPIHQYCAARRRNLISKYPPRPARKATQRIELRMSLLSDRRGRLLLERGAFPYLSHLWLPPVQAVAEPKMRGVEAFKEEADRLGSFHHTILHRQFDVQLCGKKITAAEIRRLLAASRDQGVERRLFDTSSLTHIGRSSLLTKALKRLRAQRPRDVDALLPRRAAHPEPVEG